MASRGTSEGSNYEVFRECLSSAIVQRSDNGRANRGAKRKAQKSKRGTRKPATDGAGTDTTASDSSSLPSRVNPEELAEFIDFLASETFPSLPADLQTLSYSSIQHDPVLADKYAASPLPRSLLESITATIPVAVSDSLSVYGLVPDPSDVPDFFLPVLSEYVASVTAAPPVWATTRTDACEICERDWIPLSYHHLIPRGVHAKVLKKGWHEEWMLNSVAWLCRACHSFVHRMASNEELAREYYTVERIMEREDVQDWAKWVGRVRWKAR
ncbi:HNH endonuclease [Aspergillus fischeri NRRL 181]|uniref:HNH domain-containing protein n=1 Tax=Neosartorya fischeri (strain ATCC 1020 / DSM 3700 / CBS 544.65 / FGSC A1164 / JCM 1740 / NRRL 181 / WB 181) TaxID=331117 RepID=A1D3X5_NEOFI|nr:conserved hypothetical protein [Aspergillus fischeri NRRL 181]EAW23118.1 conserved hypothetical protein [Aspergillus fischeri NRRL 181]